MRCKKIQELIKSDYLDGELSQRVKEVVDKHITLCDECRLLEKKLQAQRAVFQRIKPLQAPERVWHNVRDAIYNERLSARASLTRSILRRLKDLIFPREPVLAAVNYVLVILIISFVFGNFVSRRSNQGRQTASESILEYSLNFENGDLIYDLGTEIEEYFL